MTRGTALTGAGLLAPLNVFAKPTDTTMAKEPLILVLCTGNSCRSHLAEGILRKALKGRYRVASAGSKPAGYVHPLAIRAMAEIGEDISGHHSKHLDEFLTQEVETVITVCGNADQACPVFPGQPILAHWGMPDPAGAEGDEAAKRAAFVNALTLISRRIDLLLALPIDKLDRLIVEARVHAIGRTG